MLREKLEKMKPGILRDKTIENIYLNQFPAEFDAVDPYLFIDVKGVVHKNLRRNLESFS